MELYWHLCVLNEKYEAAETQAQGNWGDCLQSYVH